ncbi:hypothetical protein [Streptomyces spirodelae]|uniref:Uncharacterized protein n=1 Tax=Streptomyces spirodelae TaxID=2812904 RepID=A0ABS3WQ61_9ACTN|nr:hypothetical protein [Streptomyces spirodelae]MBO8185254.1 hypothetical protein [Streptomyces spirodelae]
MMNPTPHPPARTDDELARLDISLLLRYGLTTTAPGPRRTALFGDCVAGAAVILDRLGTHPRSVAFLAGTVRAGGLARSAGLPEPLPRPQAADAVRDWLRAAADLAGGIVVDDLAARWLHAVATVIEVRRVTRARG